ncbi:MAG: hypothetical protein JXA96_00315 [Sedimentisphaerales bacterium]|nr:hypothetical protein [Sedimentisphaerales bacterium]
MSTLTKILVVLLTLSSIFLCGITVTYVGTATNYKKAYDARNKDIQSLKSDNAYKAEQVNTIQANLEATTNTYSSQIEDYKNEVDSLNTEIFQLSSDLADAQTRLENATAILSDNVKTVEMNNKLRENAEIKVADLLDQQRANTNKINELQEQVVSQNATIAQLENEKKLLIDEKTKLQNNFDQTLLSANKRSVSPFGGIPATSNSAEMAPATKDIDLEGVILEVRPDDSLVSISKGSAHGVKKNMRFHVIRNNSFVCDVVVSTIDADQSSGYLDLVSNIMPKAGDKVKTNF